jgi:hypothetical protein
VAIGDKIREPDGRKAFASLAEVGGDLSNRGYRRDSHQSAISAYSIAVKPELALMRFCK